MRTKYTNISITKDLTNIMDKYIKESKKGYRSRAEFISEVIRTKIGISQVHSHSNRMIKVRRGIVK